MRLGRTLLLLLLACLAAPLAGAQAKDALTIGIPGEPPNLDPTSSAAASIDIVTYHTIFEGLVSLRADGTIAPLLATRWTVSDDRRVYTFDLRPGVRFHDGEAFDARSVIFSLTRAIAPASTNAQHDALSIIARVEAVGPLAVRITLSAPDADFLRLLTYGDAAMVPPGAATALATRPVGTGPFRFGEWRRGDRLTLERAPGYWGRPAALRHVTFRFMVDPTAAYAAVKSHDVDAFYEYPAPETLAELRRDPTLTIYARPSETKVVLAMNQRAGPLADRRVRRAIQQAVDRKAIIAGAMSGYGTPIGSHFSPLSPDYVDLTGYAPHDLGAARRLLREAGYANGFTLTLKFPYSPWVRRSSEIVAAELEQIGIHVAIRSMDMTQWLDEVLRRHQFDLTIIGHVEPFDYDIYARPDYYFGYHSAAYAALVDRLKRTTDPAQRHLLLGDVQRTLAADTANGFLFEFPMLGVQDAHLHDIWIDNPNGALDLANAYFDTGAGAGSGAPESASPGHAPGPGGRLVAIGAAGALLIGMVLIAAQLGSAYLARRAGSLALTFLAASVLIFLLVQVVPGDPAAFMMGLNATPRAVAALHAQLGLEGSAFDRYQRWLWALVHGDFGTSYTYRVPVAGLIAERIAISIPLAAMATVLSILIGIPAGYLAARARGGLSDAIFGWMARIGIAMPSFWLAILLVLLFSVMLRWLGAGGFPGWDAGYAPAFRALLLPTVALALPQAAILARVTRGALIETLAEDFIRTARAKGLSRNAVLRRHALPSAIGPVLTVLGLQVPFLIAGGAIIETVFSLPGIGRLVLQAISQRDLIVVQSVVVLLVAGTVLASFVVDIAQMLVDPRLRGGR